MFLRYCELYNPDVCSKDVDKSTLIYLKHWNYRFGVTEVYRKESQGYLKVINVFILMRTTLHVCT